MSKKITHLFGNGGWRATGEVKGKAPDKGGKILEKILHIGYHSLPLLSPFFHDHIRWRRVLRLFVSTPKKKEARSVRAFLYQPKGWCRGSIDAKRYSGEDVPLYAENLSRRHR